VLLDEHPLASFECDALHRETKAGRNAKTEMSCDTKSNDKKVVAYAQSIANDNNRETY